MHEEARKFLKKVIENYCTIEPDLFGHSDGASISIIYAGLNYPLNSLIVEAPHLMVEKITIDEITNLKSLWHKSDVRKKLEEQGVSIENADIAMIPKSTLSLETSDAKKTLHLLDKLEELEDVQRVYSNIEFKDEILENYAE